MILAGSWDVTREESVMLKGPLLHPEILEVLAAAGHGAKVLIADANYPFTTVKAPQAPVVFLNFSHGKLNVPEVFDVIAQVLPIESVQYNVPSEGNESDVVREIKELAPDEVPFSPLQRFEFYDACRSEDLCLVIATGETRIYSCALITIGYIPG